MDENEKKKNQSLRNTIKTTKHMLGFVWREKSGGIYLFLKGIISLFNAIVALVYTIFPGFIINELINELRINVLILYVGVLIMTPVVSHLINILMNRYLKKLYLALRLKFYADFYEHITSMDYETLENPDIQINKSRTQDTLNGILGIVDQMSSLMSAIFRLIAISMIIVTLNPFIIILIIGITYINALCTKRVNYKLHLIRKELDETQRYQWGYDNMLENFNFGKELRLFNLKALLVNLFVENQKKSNKINLKYQKYQDVSSTFYSFTNLIQQLVTYVYSIYSVIKKETDVGSMTIYIAAIGQFSGSLNQVMGAYLELAKNSLNVQEMMDFMNIPLKQYNTGDKTPVFDKNSVIEFKNVSFKYIGSENYALKNMNITVHGNEKLCIVGVNGSGKTTFIKLLTRLYFPTEGEILLNGININEYDYLKYQRLFAPVFQDFVKYYFSLEKNIVLASEYNKERLDEICYKSGLSSLINKLPKGYDTLVDKWIDKEGFEPSGGENQRIAIARAIYHDAPIFLLDEPTAALDPLAEYEIYTQFNEMITDRTAVLITHRLSAVQLTDKVAVFENGGLIEYGTHKQLCEKDGSVYADMFNKQAQFYRKYDNIESDGTIASE